MLLADKRRIKGLEQQVWGCRAVVHVRVCMHVYVSCIPCCGMCDGDGSVCRYVVLRHEFHRRHIYINAPLLYQPTPPAVSRASANQACYARAPKSSCAPPKKKRKRKRKERQRRKLCKACSTLRSTLRINVGVMRVACQKMKMLLDVEPGAGVRAHQVGGRGHVCVRV